MKTWPGSGGGGLQKTITLYPMGTDVAEETFAYFTTLNCCHKKYLRHINLTGLLSRDKFNTRTRILKGDFQIQLQQQHSFTLAKISYYTGVGAIMNLGVSSDVS